MIAVRKIIFDADEVLWYVADTIHKNWNAWADRVGIGHEFVSNAMGQRAQDLMPRLVPGIDVDTEVKWMRDADFESAKHVAPIPGARFWIAYFNERERLNPRNREIAVSTSSEEAMCRTRARSARIDLPLLVASETVTNQKPAIDCTALCAMALGARSPQECAFIDDSPANGAVAKQNGFRWIQIGDREVKPGDPQPDLKVSTLVDLTFQFGKNGLIEIDEGYLWSNPETRRLAARLGATDQSFPVGDNELSRPLLLDPL